MKKLFILLITVLFAAAGFSQKYERIHSPTEHFYSVKAEMELEYTSDMFFDVFENRIVFDYKMVSPFFLDFNLNDLLFFKAEPSEFLGYEGGFMSANSYFIDSKGIREISAGMTTFTKYFNKSTSPAESAESNLTGQIRQSPEISFSLVGLSKYLKSKQRPELTLFISSEACENFEQNVSGVIKSSDAQGGSFTITENLTIPMVIAYQGQSYPDKLIEAQDLSNTKDMSHKDYCIWLDNFQSDFYKTLPKIDALSLVEYLINPKGVYEIPFSGFLKSTKYKESFTFKGKIKVYGEKRFKHWVGENL